MNIKNQFSPAFGRVYIKADDLSHRQYMASLDFAEQLSRYSIPYQQAHDTGLDLYISSSDNDDTFNVKYMDYESGKYYFRKNKNLLSTDVNIKNLNEGIEDVENDINDLLENQDNFRLIRRSKRLNNSISTQVVTTGMQDVRVLGEPGKVFELAEPSESNPEHIWIA